MPTALITGASRGIGLEHARQYARRGWRVLGTVRHAAPGAPAGELASRFPNQIDLQSLDVTDHEAIDELAARWASESIDILINNAGTYGPKGAPEGMAYQTPEGMDYRIWRAILEVNLLSPLRITVAFRPHLLRGRTRCVVMMSSDLGSIGQNQTGGSHAYRSSKAGLNMLTKGMAREWPDLTFVAMAPGWTRTDLGGPQAPIEAAESVRLQQQVFDRLTPTDSGRFLNRFGESVPW